ncbi:hypothetical protein FA95DRAFT_1563635 [Auriscalpium vulgare]|uniref:Uncharacterized protein n=1 Tax=Auriscalpium vulgare TaxID=40419 RepID=A0ACB8RHS3_9AGAM|nr:hypothetical protein FA95DRAFT_1563635 [Auriscalpium vulgare]
MGKVLLEEMAYVRNLPSSLKIPEPSKDSACDHDWLLFQKLHDHLSTSWGNSNAIISLEDILSAAPHFPIEARDIIRDISSEKRKWKAAVKNIPGSLSSISANNFGANILKRDKESTDQFKDILKVFQKSMDAGTLKEAATRRFVKVIPECIRIACQKRVSLNRAYHEVAKLGYPNLSKTVSEYEDAVYAAQVLESLVLWSDIWHKEAQKASKRNRSDLLSLRR